MLINMRVLVVYALISCSALVGCGTKGPLYIPEQRYPQKQAPQNEAPKTTPQTNTDAASQHAP